MNLCSDMVNCYYIVSACLSSCVEHIMRCSLLPLLLVCVCMCMSSYLYVTIPLLPIHVNLALHLIALSFIPSTLYVSHQPSILIFIWTLSTINLQSQLNLSSPLCHSFCIRSYLILSYLSICRSICVPLFFASCLMIDVVCSQLLLAKHSQLKCYWAH